jgi:hypothetical protein
MKYEYVQQFQDRIRKHALSHWRTSKTYKIERTEKTVYNVPVLWSYGLFWNISGLMYSGVPMKVLAMSSGCSNRVAMPKSPSIAMGVPGICDKNIIQHARIRNKSLLRMLVFLLQVLEYSRTIKSFALQQNNSLLTVKRSSFMLFKCG